MARRIKRRKKAGKSRVERVAGLDASDTGLEAGSADETGASSDPGAGLEAGTGAGAGEGEKVGLVPGVFQMNELQIDPAQLQSEAAALAQEFPAAPAPAAAAELAPPVDPNAQAGFEVLALGSVTTLAAVFVPAWEVTQEECRTLSDAIVRALMLWFPDGMLPPKYMAVLAVAGAGATIAFARMDPKTGALKPMKYAKPVADQPKPKSNEAA
jgi:hypothetical protein